MVSTFSPHHDAGGTLHLHSPTHLGHIDPHSAIREIRRSLSRSPSKGAGLRQQSLRSQSPSTGSVPFSPSPLSPSRRSTSDHFLYVPSPIASPHAVPFPPSARIHRPNMRRGIQTQGTPRSRTSPKSPSKRVLTDSCDGGNSSPMPLRKRTSTEADREASVEIVPLFADKENELKQGTEMTPRSHAARLEKRLSGGLAIPAPPVSPMKRNDSAMTLGQPNFGSPSAKRRSLHGPGLDFSIFETDSMGSEDYGEQRRSQDDIDWQRYGSPMSSTRFSTIPKRSSSLRKSTLQQRQAERPPLVRNHPLAEEEALPITATPAFADLKTGQRLSLDNHLAPMPRDSPFSSQGSLLSASIHPIATTNSSQPAHFPHPLSRTMTQSSSTSSMADDSPTHEPIHRSDRPRSNLDFSKSLPIGASRPTMAFRSDDDPEACSQGSFATPANYKSAKPLPAAFMSTGLISKKNRNVEEPHGGLPKAHMPDTPCKRQINVFPAKEQLPLGKGDAVSKTARHSLGTPSTPLDSHHSMVKPAPFAFSKSVGIFGSTVNKHALARKTSFVSIDGDDKSQSLSPSAAGDSQSTAESEYPPTPTKRMTGDGVLPSRISPLAQSKHMRGLSNFVLKSANPTKFRSSKLSPVGASPGSIDGDSDSVMEDSPSASLRLKSSLTTASAPSPSFTQGRLLRNLNSPSPISRKALAVPLFYSPRSGRTNWLVFLQSVHIRQDLSGPLLIPLKRTASLLIRAICRFRHMTTESPFIQARVARPLFQPRQPVLENTSQAFQIDLA